MTTHWQDFMAGKVKVGDLPPPKPTLKPDPPKAAFTFTAVADLEFRDPVFLVEDLIETETLGLLFGDPGCGKSFLAVDLALSVATGRAFHGRTVKQGAVFYIAGEGHNGLARRFHAWAEYYGVALDGVPLYKSERAAQFLDAAHAKTVADAVDDRAAEVGQPRLIVVDTLARNFGAGDENSTQDMSKFIVAMDDLRTRYPESVLLIVHHSGHAEKGRARGAIALKGALDFEYWLVKAGDNLTLSCTKMKDAAEPSRIAFKLEDCGKSAVLVETDPPSAQVKLSGNQQLGIETYKEAARANGGTSGTDGTFRGVPLDDWRECFYLKHTGDDADSKRKAFQRVREGLVSKGIMQVNDNIYLLATDEVSELL